MQRIMMEFEKQSEKMDMKEEMVNDTLDTVFEAENEEEEVLFS
jgi:charged multivesicular body protein 2A